MSQMFSRGALTDHLLTTLREGLSFPVGDGVAPTEGGWTDGQPGQGKFQVYTVLSTTGGNVNHRSPVGDDHDDWVVSYTLRSVGRLRGQSDWVADRTRLLLTGQDLPQKLDLDGPWKMCRVAYASLGAILRNDSTDPPYWECTDAFGIWLSRART